MALLVKITPPIRSTYLGSWLYSLGGLAFFHLSFQARMAQAAVKRDAQRLLYNEMLSVHVRVHRTHTRTQPFSWCTSFRSSPPLTLYFPHSLFSLFSYPVPCLLYSALRLCPCYC